MAKFRYQHIKSSVEGKAPTAAQIKVAEIGVNDFAGDEKLFIKNSNNEVVDFPRGYSRQYLDDLDSRKLDSSAYTPTDLTNYYTKSETSGATELATEFSNYYTKSETSGATELSTAFDTINVSIEDLSGQSETVAAALNELNGRKLDASAYTPTDLSNYYTKDETSGKTEISNALGAKVNTATFTAHTADITIHLTSGDVETQISAYTYSRDEIDDSENVIAAALNDLNGRKLDASAYTPTDLTNYYTKSETSGKTEISNALGAKVNTATFTAHTADSTVHIISSERTAWNAMETSKLDSSVFNTYSAATNTALTDLESIVGSGYTNTTITEVIENMDTAIAAALTDLDDKIGDIESILATI